MPPIPYLQLLLKLAQFPPDASVLLGHLLTESLLKHTLTQGLGELHVKPAQAEHMSWHRGTAPKLGPLGQGEAVSLPGTERERERESLMLSCKVVDGGYVGGIWNTREQLLVFIKSLI